jgi:hypothetical protein
MKRSWQAYYGFFYEGGHAITFGGETGELVNLPMNHYGNIASHILTMVTATRPSFQARSVNTDVKSQIQTNLANGLLEYYMRDKRLEQDLKRAVEFAIVMGSGYVKMEWNATLLNSFIEYIEENFHNIFLSKSQKRFAEALFKKIKGYEFADEINRRDILNELSTDLNIERGLITKHTNRIASLYTTFKISFETTGQMPKFKEKLHLTKEDENYIKEHYSHYSQSNGINGLSRTLGIKYDIVRDWVNEPSNFI